MQALILATDEGSKLQPLTGHLPAPLLPVLNRPVIAYPLELLVRAGLRDVGIAVYNRAGAIEAHFATGSRSGAQLTYLLQREALGSAGSLRWAASGLRQTFVVLPGDAMVDVDVCDALAFHQSHGGIATVIAHEPRAGYPLHVVAVDNGGRVAGIPTEEGVEASTPGGGRLLADTGAYIFEPRIFDWIPPLQVMDCHSDLLPELLGREAVYAYAAKGYWNPVHSVPAYHQAQLDALAAATRNLGPVDGRTVNDGAPRVRYVSVEDRELAPGILTGRHVSVHPSAHLVAPVYIGSGSQIERDVEVGPGVVVGANTVVDEGATIRNSSVLDGTYVGRLVKVEGRVVRGGLVTDAASGESLRIVDPFLLGEVSPHLFVSLLSRIADAAGALLLLLLLLPALALITVALLIASPLSGSRGRVFELRPRVRWRRTGEGDAPEKLTYGVLYFRTHRPDRTVAPLGSFLKRARLDRLPALVSVLAGDLRLVGVKPLDAWEANRLVEEWQRLPYEGAAGFTGLWFVRAGGADLDEIVATDAYYTATRSFLEDLYLLFSTPGAWVRSWAPIGAGQGTPQGPARRSSVERRLLSISQHSRSRSPDTELGGVTLADSSPRKAPGA